MVKGSVALKLDVASRQRLLEASLAHRNMRKRRPPERVEGGNAAKFTRHEAEAAESSKEDPGCAVEHSKEPLGRVGLQSEQMAADAAADDEGSKPPCLLWWNLPAYAGEGTADVERTADAPTVSGGCTAPDSLPLHAGEGAACDDWTAATDTNASASGRRSLQSLQDAGNADGAAAPPTGSSNCSTSNSSGSSFLTAGAVVQGANYFERLTETLTQHQNEMTQMLNVMLHLTTQGADPPASGPSMAGLDSLSRMQLKEAGEGLSDAQCSARRSIGSKLFLEPNLLGVAGGGSMAAGRNYLQKLNLSGPNEHLDKATEWTAAASAGRNDCLNLSGPKEHLDKACEGSADAKWTAATPFASNDWSPLNLLGVERSRFLAEREARLCPPGKVPPFHEGAHGTPKEWNELMKPMYWGRKTRRYFTPHTGGHPDVNKVMEFLQMRQGPSGHSVMDFVEPPHDTAGDGWWLFAWKGFNQNDLPRSSTSGWGPADWQQAWHGCKFEALYSIMFHGRLMASCDPERGDRFFASAPGVYVHKNDTALKIGNYMRFVELCRDGVFWAASWLVWVDRSDRVPKSRTDQWIQQERSVRLAGLYICGTTYENMQPGWEVSEVWDPILEANPRSIMVGARPAA